MFQFLSDLDFTILCAYVPAIQQSRLNKNIAHYHQPIEQHNLNSYPCRSIAKVLKLPALANLQNSGLTEKLAGMELARQLVNNKSFDDVGKTG